MHVNNTKYRNIHRIYNVSKTISQNYTKYLFKIQIIQILFYIL